MAAPSQVRSQYTHQYGSSKLPVLEEIFWTAVEQYPGVRDQLLRTKSTSTDIYQSSEVHDMELFREMAEGEEYSYERPLQGASKTLTVSKFGLGFNISEETIDDGKFEWIGTMTRQLAESARESKEIAGMGLFNNGFTGGTETTADGQPIFASAHTLPGGATFRNILSTAADLSVTSLDQMLSDFATQFVGDTGIIKMIKPRILLVHERNRRYAQELIGSDLKADTANNNMNSLKGEGLIVVASPHLVDEDAWFLLSDKDKHSLTVVERQALRTKSKEDFDTDSMRYKASYREKVGAFHPLGVFGTAGA
jgi:hypothetical protein